jgi:hypothetical protein
MTNKLLAGFTAFVFGGLWMTPARGEVTLVAADLQSLVAVTQPGWSGMGGDVDIVLPAVQVLALTASGSAVGITATLDGVSNWNPRGQDRDRAVVLGTTFNDVVSDLWFNRSMSYSLTLGGLAQGTRYTLRAWHNDSYTINTGAAAGGGIVTPTLTGGTIVTSTTGAITNLHGLQTDASFGVAMLEFTADGTGATITMTRSGGDFTGIPVSGLQVTTLAVPEPTAFGLACTSIAIAAGWCLRRHSGIHCKRIRFGRGDETHGSPGDHRGGSVDHGGAGQRAGS